MSGHGWGDCRHETMNRRRPIGERQKGYANFYFPNNVNPPIRKYSTRPPNTIQITLPKIFASAANCDSGYSENDARLLLTDRKYSPVPQVGIFGIGPSVFVAVATFDSGYISEIFAESARRGHKYPAARKIQQALNFTDHFRRMRIIWRPMGSFSY